MKSKASALMATAHRLQKRFERWEQSLLKVAAVALFAAGVGFFAVGSTFIASARPAWVRPVDPDAARLLAAQQAVADRFPGARGIARRGRIEARLREGMTAAEVEAAIGPPSSSMIQGGTSEWWYECGEREWPNLLGERIVLILYFDGTGHLGKWSGADY